MRITALRAVIMMACLVPPFTPAQAAGEPGILPVTNSPPFTEDDFVLLQTDADGVALSDALGAYSSRAGLYLPIGELARLLELAIDVDPAAQTASGWIVAETRAFDINLVGNFGRIEGREIQFQPGDAVFVNDEIYVRAELAQSIAVIQCLVDAQADRLDGVTSGDAPVYTASDSLGGAVHEPDGNVDRDVISLKLEEVARRVLRNGDGLDVEIRGPAVEREHVHGAVDRGGVLPDIAAIKRDRGRAS